MRTFRNAKAMAKTLRQELADRQIDLLHSDCLEIVARQFGCGDWNILSAKMDEGAGRLQLPAGWSVSGSKPDHYEMGVMSGERSPHAVIRSRFRADDPQYARLEQGFGTLMQSVLADGYRGKTLRLAAELRTEDLDGAGTLWMRVDGAPGQTLRFDNMEERSANGAIRADSDWTPREIVLDIPDNATTINYGFYLRGAGTVRARSLVLEEAAAAVTSARHRSLDRPTNLGFRLT